MPAGTRSDEVGRSVGIEGLGGGVLCTIGGKAVLGITSQGTRPVQNWRRGWPDLGPDIVSHLKLVVMTCKY
jgi:hypothetical protein